MHIDPTNNEGNEESTIQSDVNSASSDPEANTLKALLEVLLDSLKQCRIAIELYGDRNQARDPPSE